MTTVTLQIPGAQMGWFEQMVRAMGWTFRKEETSEANSRQTITPVMRRAITKARKESAQGELKVCHTPKEMQQYFDAL